MTVLAFLAYLNSVVLLLSCTPHCFHRTQEMSGRRDREMQGRWPGRRLDAGVSVSRHLIPDAT